MTDLSYNIPTDTLVFEDIPHVLVFNIINGSSLKFTSPVIAECILIKAILELELPINLGTKISNIVNTKLYLVNVTGSIDRNVGSMKMFNKVKEILYNLFLTVLSDNVQSFFSITEFKHISNGRIIQIKLMESKREDNRIYPN